MSTRIGILSDVHARPEPLQHALKIFERGKVDLIICAGDIAGYYDQLLQTIDLLTRAQCRTIIGNHDQTYLQEHPDENDQASQFLKSLPNFLNFSMEQKSIYVVHAEPPDQQHGGIKLLDQQGEFILQQVQQWEQALNSFEHDILIVGHTHQVYALQLGNTLVINPGSSAFNHSCMILNLPELTVETFALEDKAIIKCWNFSMLYGSGSHYPTEKKIT
jgi:putative phosphoesterase